MAQTTGITTFESALQSLVYQQKDQKKISVNRLDKIVNKIKQIGQEKRNALAHELEIKKEKQQTKRALQEKALQLIKQGFQRSLSEFTKWLYLPNLLARYQNEIVENLQQYAASRGPQETLENWLREDFEKTVLNYQNSLHSWLEKTSDFFEQEGLISLSISLPKLSTNTQFDPEKSNKNSTDEQIASTAVPASFGWLFGGPVGAVVLGSAGYILHKVSKSEIAQFKKEKQRQIYTEIAEVFLTNFSQEAFSVLKEYEKEAEKLMIISSREKIIDKSFYQLQLLDNLLDSLDQELNLLIS